MNAEPKRASFAADAVPTLLHGNSFHPPRPTLKAMRRGFSAHCPACGKGELFERFLQRRPRCEACGERFDAAEPDGLAPLIAAPLALVAGAGLALVLDALAEPPLWLTLALCESAAVGIALHFAVRANGLVLGLAWAVRLRGFDPSHRDCIEPQTRGSIVFAPHPRARPFNSSTPAQSHGDLSIYRQPT